MNEEKKEALWMPAGSVRSILAIGTSLGVLALLFCGYDVPEWLAVIFGIILRDYFAGGEKRDTSKLINGNK